MTTKTRAKTRRIELAWVAHPDACFDHLISLGWSDREATHAIGILALYGMGRDGAAAAHPGTMTKLRNALRDVPTPAGQPPRIGRSFQPGANESGRARLRVVGAVAAASMALAAPSAFASSTTTPLGTTPTAQVIVMSTWREEDENDPISGDNYGAVAA